MVWFKVDDGFYTSRKVLSIPRRNRLAAVGLWTMAGNWSGRELTDGMVPMYVLDELGATETLIQALVTARLWLDHRSVEAQSSLGRGSACIEFSKWAEYQPTREKVESDREKERIRKENYRLSRRDTHGTPTDVPPESHEESQGASEYPDPTRPDPTNELPDGSSLKGAAKRPTTRGTRIPEPFMVTAEMRAWAASRTPNVDVNTSTEMFVNYWRAKAGREAIKRDWIATWHNWLLTDEQKAGRAPAGTRPTRGQEHLAYIASLANEQQEIEA